MNRGHDVGERDTFPCECRVKAEHTGECLIHGKSIARQIPVPSPDDCTGLQGELNPFDNLAGHGLTAEAILMPDNRDVFDATAKVLDLKRTLMKI